MGKKSRRRAGGGGTAKSSGGDSDDQRLIPHEALLQVTAPKSLTGIFSTNDEPTSCLYCNKSVVAKPYWRPCCGKVFCGDCPGDFIDIRREQRCAACNILVSKSLPILQTQASLGKAWAQHMLGGHLVQVGKFAEARDFFILSALEGNFDSFLSLSRMYCERRGVFRDLKLSEAFARKARALHAECGLSSNLRLFRIVIYYSKSGAKREVNDLLLEILHETDESALDGHLCRCVAAYLFEENPHPSAQMYARAFCYGHIESAMNASIAYEDCRKLALAKFWLDVACKTKSLYEISQANFTFGGEEIFSWPHYEEYRNDIRSDLREMRNSCGGCGASLSGERRKYCRCCRTYCYCNEDCQKRHWEDGHREECKEVEEHMRNILRAIRLGRFDWIQKME